jgi:pentapeptide repeat protein
MPGEDPRQEFDPDWPLCDERNCRGVRHNGPKCVAHSGDLDGFAPGTELDLRGVVVDSGLLAGILGRFRDHTARRFVFGPVRCDHTWFNGKAWFDKARFESTADFDRAWFGDAAWFDGAICVAKLSFADTRFAGRVFLDSMTAPRMDLSGAWFTEPLAISGDVDRVHCVGTRFDGGVTIVTAGEVDATRTRFEAPSTITAAKVVSLAGSDVSDLVLTDTDLRECGFLGAHRLEQLRVDGRTRFAEPEGLLRARRRMLADEGNGNPARVAALYRSLRKSFEDSKNEAGAGDFYYGEMEARRRSDESSVAERAILSVYWLVSGYGQRAWRSLAALLGVIAAVTTVLTVAGTDFGLAARIALGTALSKDPQAELTATGEWVVLVARFLGPVLLALAALAVRARVRR